ncbi:FAD-dependent monooxygenase [Amorphus sp. 3PC139-8]|uniref:FAD-dependent monooxygenase n=1 Tax=Amorphus sp. 3PC139-8 TaxID=2735676 RepID=UPI00345CB132
MSDRRPPRIAVVGAGIGGLTVTAALRKLGLPATIYEQAPAFGRVGAGIQLTPNAVKVLRVLGLEQQVRAAAFAPEVGYNRDARTGDVTFLHPMGKVTEDRYDAPDLSMHRAVLHGALESQIPHEQIAFGKVLAGVDREGDAVRLSFEDGDSVVADLVIGADGIHSIVRHTLVGEEALSFTGRVAYRSVYRSERLGRKIDDRVKWWGEERHIVTYKIDPRREELYFIASTPEPDFEVESWSALGDRDTLLAAYEGFHPDARIVLESAPDVRKWALAVRKPLQSWSDERITLLGDAAHPMVPYMAQGAGSAMEDAIILARLLSKTDPDGYPAALKVYEAHRIPRTTRIQRAASQNKWMHTASDTDTDWLYGYDAWNGIID